MSDLIIFTSNIKQYNKRLSHKEKTQIHMIHNRLHNVGEILKEQDTSEFTFKFEMSSINDFTSILYFC